MKQKKLLTCLFVFGLFALLAPVTVKAWTYKPASTEDLVGRPYFSADGKYMVLLSDVSKKTFKQVLFFNKDTSKPAWVFSPDKMVNNVGISGNGQYIAAVGSKIWLFKNNSNKPLWSKQIGVSVFDAVALSPNGGYIVAGDRLSKVSLFFNAQSKVNKTWSLGSEDGIASLAISNDGKSILAGTHLSVNFIKLDKSKPVWRYRTKNHVEQVRLSSNGKYAVASDRDTIYFFDTSKNTPLWTKSFKDMYAPNIAISEDGSVIMASTTKAAYAYNIQGKQLWSYDMPSGLIGELALSGSGKYAAVSQGQSYVYLFDNAFGSGNRPFRYYTDKSPRYVALDKIGDLLAYGRNNLSLVTPPPGIIADQKSVPVYYDGATLSLRVFATNPGAAKNNLKVKVAMSLPQINWWDGAASQKEAQNQKPTTRSKALQYAAEALPGYSVLYDEAYPLAKNSSCDTTLTLNVPSLLFPQWLSDMLTGLNNILPFDDLMGDWSSSLEKLTGKDQKDQLITDTNRQFINKNAVFPMLGLGTVQLYDKDTGVVYDTDSFYFIYGLMGT